jgi:hypothetical protein
MTVACDLDGVGRPFLQMDARWKDKLPSDLGQRVVIATDDEDLVACRI